MLDGDGNVMPDAMLEIWQADAQGRYAHPADGRPLASNSFRGFGRAATDKDGGFFFATIKPGQVPGPGRHAAGAAHQRRAVRARPPEAAVHAHLLRRRSGQRHRSDPGAGAGRAPRHADGQARPGQARPLALRHPPAGPRRNRLLRRVGVRARGSDTSRSGSSCGVRPSGLVTHGSGGVRASRNQECGELIGEMRSLAPVGPYNLCRAATPGATLGRADVAFQALHPASGSIGSLAPSRLVQSCRDA